MTSTGTLHMADRTWSDSGNYTCFATNELGYANRTGFLFIYNSVSVGFRRILGFVYYYNLLLFCIPCFVKLSLFLIAP